MGVIESRLIQEEGTGQLFGPGLKWEPKFDHGAWQVWIDHTPWPSDTYTVHAKHQKTGATTSATDTMTGEIKIIRSLAKARDRAGQMATTLRGTMEKFNWRAAS